MINHKDYNAVYNVLNSTFRDNNFKTINNLKKYIQNNFYQINDIEIKNGTDKDNFYTFTCKLINQENSKDSKNINIIISKTDNTNFEISFSFE